MDVGQVGGDARQVLLVGVPLADPLDPAACVAAPRVPVGWGLDHLAATRVRPHAIHVAAAELESFVPLDLESSDYRYCILLQLFLSGPAQNPSIAIHR